jgi:hypothetical protein
MLVSPRDPGRLGHPKTEADRRSMPFCPKQIPRAVRGFTSFANTPSIAAGGPRGRGWGLEGIGKEGGGEGVERDDWDV